jgi:mitogen-activated protein kinase organizer 1
VNDIAVIQDNSMFASGGKDKVHVCNASRIVQGCQLTLPLRRQLIWVWDVEQGKAVRKFRGHQAAVNSLAFNQDNSLLISGGYDKYLCVWDLRARGDTPLQVMTDFQDSVTKVFFTKDMSQIYGASVDGCIRRYDLRKGQLFVDHIARPIVDMAISRDSNCILAGCLDSTVRLFEKESGELLSSYTGHVCKESKTECKLTNTDAHVVAGSEDGRVVFYDLVEEKEVQSLKCHKGCVTSITYHPDEVAMATAGLDGVARVWTGAPKAKR